mgnify:CR=1 FL=1
MRLALNATLRRASGELARRSVERQWFGRSRGASRPARRALGGGRRPAQWCLCGRLSPSGAVMSPLATSTRSPRARRARTTRAKSILWYVHPSRRRAVARERTRDRRSRPDRRFCCFFSRVLPSTRRRIVESPQSLSSEPADPPPPQVVEDILNHSEEIAVAEDGHGGEVTLLRLLKVRGPHRETTRDITSRNRDVHACIKSLALEATESGRPDRAVSATWESDGFSVFFPSREIRRSRSRSKLTSSPALHAFRPSSKPKPNLRRVTSPC